MKLANFVFVFVFAQEICGQTVRLDVHVDTGQTTNVFLTDTCKN